VEGFAETVLRAEPTLLRQIIDRESTCSDPMHGLLETNETEESTRRDSPSLLEQTCVVKPAHLWDACHFRHSNGTIIVPSAELLDLAYECGHGRRLVGRALL
jgi:hypothetical protein